MSEDYTGVYARLSPFFNLKLKRQMLYFVGLNPHVWLAEQYNHI